jgi:hypothetical protein
MVSCLGTRGSFQWSRTHAAMLGQIGQPGGGFSIRFGATSGITAPDIRLMRAGPIGRCYIVRVPVAPA